MNAPAPQWDAWQREVLSELGLQPYGVVPSEVSAPPEALLDALARAGGCSRELVAALPGLPRLRGDARAKRALWPTLRRLRAGGG